MKKQLTQSGFAIVEMAIIVVLAAAIVATGIFVWHEHSKNNATATTITVTGGYQSPTTTTPPAPQINTASDLSSALSALNQTSVSSSNVDSGQLSTYSSGF